MASRYPSQTETTNFARLSRLVLDVCSDVLRDVLDTHIPPPGLHSILKSQKHYLKQKLGSRQLSILYPPGNVFPGTLKDLDLSLLYSLVRNIQGINISPHTNGWGKEPDATDRSLAANIDRLRVLRNEAYGHLPKASLSDTDFHSIWGTIRQCVSEIEQGTLTGDTYVREVDNLLNMTMDPDTEKEYVERLKKQRDEFEAVVEELKARQVTMETGFKSVAARQDSMETKQKSVSARQDTMETEQKSISARQDTMETEQKCMTARLDTVESQQKTTTESMTKEIHPDLKPMIDSNINPVGAERVSQLMESFISAAVPGHTESCTPSENTGAIAIPEISSGAVANPTTVNQFTINYNDLREYKDEFNIETMKVRHAENLSIGEQLVLPPGGPPVSDHSAASSSHSKNIHSDLLPQIKTTGNRIKTEKEKKFIQTRAYHDAQEKLRMNRVLVIKGNTGDGKTSTAFQLVHWLMEEQQCRKPLQLHKIEKLDSLAPHLNLACIIDDIFGEKDIGRLDVQEWNKRLKDVETLFANKQNQTNILIITIRNEIFNVLEEKSLGTVFTKDNIIDLSSNEYKIKEEKQKLLAMYTPPDLKWTQKEEKKIVGYATHIGFPQCCQLFYNSAELQKKRAEFFEKPVKFFIQALSNLPECSAILFLFLNGGKIKVNDLDPNGDKVDKTLLEQAFRIKLVNSEVRTKREYEEKVDFVKESLDKLLGFLVKKEKDLWSDEEVYRFDHDSIYVTVALLYGKKTPVGYIKHCHRKALSYLTTVETSTDMVVISSGHYNDLCERLLREFESVERYDGVIGSQDLWTDRFIEIFDKYLDEKKVNKLKILNKACGSGLVKLALYLLKRGVKPDEDTMLRVVRGVSVDLYNTVRQYGVTPTGRGEVGMNALHVACVLERVSIAGELCVDYPHLLHDTDWLGQTPLHMAAMTGNCSIFQTVEKTVLKSLCRVEDEQHQCEREEDCLVHRHCVCSQYMCQLVDRVWGMTVLHWSCVWGRKDLCVYICRTYPAMTACVDSEGSHCLHYIARHTRYIDWFIKVESYVRKHTETLKQYYDIKTILNGEGKSVLDLAKERKELTERRGERNPLYDHLLEVFSK